MTAKSLIVLASVAALLGFANPSSAKELAVVVGNNAYQEVTPLQTAVNDAQAMSAGLQRAGFAVELVENGTKRQMSRAFSIVEGRIEPGDTVVFHYSGHGFEIDGQNWLLPVDVPAAHEGEASLVKDEAFNAADVIERFRSRGAARVVAILDACRNNPFARTGTRALSGSRGLARMDAEGGEFIMFSAGAKQEALDRLSDNDPVKTSVFVRSFVPLLARKDLTLVDMAKETQERVRSLAQSVGHDQIPAYYDGIVGRVTLTGDAPSTPTSVQANVAAATPQTFQPAPQPQTFQPAPQAAQPAPPPQKPVVVASREMTSPEIEACDRAAASPLDKEKPANIPGVDFQSLAAQTGIVSCLKASQIPGAPRRVFFQLGRSYAKMHNGREAAKAYIKGAELKHPAAMHNLAVLEENGEGMPRDYSAARVLFESAAAAGVTESLTEVGKLYQLGKGAPRDYRKAVFYFEKAVEAGDANANNQLGKMYFDGTGVRRDRKKACEYFANSARLGNPTGAQNLRRVCR